MEINFIDEFLTLAKVKNYLLTAEELYISQSSLSKHIIKLEKELGVKLFNRNTRSLCLTKEGEAFIPYAIKITESLSKYKKTIMTKQIKKDNKIMLASTPQIIQYGIIEKIAQFKRNNPNGDLEIIIKPHNKLKQLLAKNEVDFIWIGEEKYKIKNKRYKTINVIRDKITLVCNKNHPLAKYNKININKIKDYEFLIQNNFSMEQNLFKKFCEKNRISPKLNSMPGGKLIIELVKKNFGITIMLETPAKAYQSKELHIIEIENSPVVYVNLIYSNERKLSDLSKKFLNFLNLSN